MKWIHWLRGKLLLIACAGVVVWTSLRVLVYVNNLSTSREAINRLIRSASHRILRLLKTRYQVILTEPLDLKLNERVIFMSNHLSHIDLPLIFASIPGTIRVIIKKELTHIPLFGKALLNSECIAIDREKPSEMTDFFEKAKNQLGSGLKLWIFPEGTRSRTGELLPLKSGGIRLACEAGARIVPVAIQGTDKVLPAGTWDVMLHQTLVIRIGKPIDTEGCQTIVDQKKIVDRVYMALTELREAL